MPAEGGYAGWLHGKVVDMFYFPLINGTYPDWFPIWGGEPFQFFRPVFNLADTSISTGVGMILVFQKRFFPETKEQDSKKATRAESESSETIPQTKTSEENNS
jgi:signal peptidase II